MERLAGDPIVRASVAAGAQHIKLSTPTDSARALETVYRRLVV